MQIAATGVAWLVVAALFNHVWLVLFGYPVVYCAGSALFSRLFPVLGFFQSLLLLAVIPLLFLRRWGFIGGLFFLAGGVYIAGFILESALYRNLC